jgi:hypothetical protein
MACVIQYGGSKKQMRNNQSNKGSAETRANNQPNNSMEAWSGTMVNGNAPWSAIQRNKERGSASAVSNEVKLIL